MVAERGHSSKTHAIMEVHLFARLHVAAAEIALAARAAAAQRPVAVFDTAKALLIASKSRFLVGKVANQVFALRLTKPTGADFLTVILHHAMLGAEEPHAVLAEPRRTTATDKQAPTKLADLSCNCCHLPTNAGMP
jgi:hypothetical protein